MDYVLSLKNNNCLVKDEYYLLEDGFLFIKVPSTQCRTHNNETGMSCSQFLLIPVSFVKWNDPESSPPSTNSSIDEGHHTSDNGSQKGTFRLCPFVRTDNKNALHPLVSIVLSDGSSEREEISPSPCPPAHAQRVMRSYCSLCCGS